MQSSSTTRKILIEALDGFLVIGTIMIVGVIGLYYNVFVIEVRDLMGLGADTQEVQATLDRSVTSDIVAESRGEELLAFVDTIKSSSPAKLHDYPLEQYLQQSLGQHEFRFSSIPPGRFLRIPSLDVEAPIIDIPFATPDKMKNGDFDEELEHGVVQYPYTTNPGEKGNTLIFGHSSVDVFDAVSSDFGYIFYKLPSMEVGDIIQVVWDGTLLEYEVSEKLIVTPEEVPDLVNKKGAVDMITLMACYPILSDAKRILVKATPVDKTAEPESLFSYTGSVE